MDFRTDLAIESLENIELLQGEKQEKLKVYLEETNKRGFDIKKVKVDCDNSAKILKKSKGTYITVEIESIENKKPDAFVVACEVIASLISEMIDENGTALVVGLGNRDITPDAIGPVAVENILATRHLVSDEFPLFKDWSSVCAIAPGVLGQTGMEASEVICGVVEIIKPSVIIAIDALACSRLSRLLKTIQITDTGIVPGSGIGNSRFALNKDTLGIPVIAIGVPTVVDGATLAHDIMSQTKKCEALEDLSKSVIVTTKDIDKQVEDISKVIGYAINKALHSKLSIEDISQFLS